MIRFALASLLCLVASLAEAAGFQLIEVPASGALPSLKGAITEDCPMAGGKLLLVVISHGRAVTSWATTTQPRRWPTQVSTPSRSIIPAIPLGI